LQVQDGLILLGCRIEPPLLLILLRREKVLLSR
jgi:hypothetical protein